MITIAKLFKLSRSEYIVFVAAFWLLSGDKAVSIETLVQVCPKSPPSLEAGLCVIV